MTSTKRECHSVTTVPWFGIKFL